MEKSCRNRASPCDSGDPGSRRAFLKAYRDSADHDLGTADFFDWQLRSGWINDHRCELNRILGCRQNQLALPGHRSPSRQVVRLQPMSLSDFIDHRAGPEAFRNDPRLQLVWPVPMNLTSRISGRENLQCTLHGETPVARPWKADHRLGKEGQRGSRTSVTIFPTIVNLDVPAIGLQSGITIHIAGRSFIWCGGCLVYGREKMFNYLHIPWEIKSTCMFTVHSSGGHPFVLSECGYLTQST